MEAVAARAGVPVDVVKSVLQVKEPEQLELIAKELAAQIPLGGGEWVGGAFRYNTAVTPVNVTIIKNVYVDRTVVINNTTANRISYNGAGGVRALLCRQCQARSSICKERLDDCWRCSSRGF